MALSFSKLLTAGIALGIICFNPLALPAHADLSTWKEHLNVAHQAMMSNHNTEALNAIDRALSANPNAWEAYLKRAQIYEKMGNHSQVIANYNQVMALNPRLESVWAHRYHYFMGKKMYQQAEYDLSEGLRLLPQSARLNYLQAMHYLKKKEKPMAMSYFERVASLQGPIIPGQNVEPFFIRSSSIRALMYAQQKQMEPYGRELNLLIAMQPTQAPLYLQRAIWNYNFSQNMPAAKRDLNNYIYLEPRDARAYFLRGNINLAGELCSDALKDLQAACALGEKKACYRKPPCEVPEKKAAPAAPVAAAATAS